MNKPQEVFSSRFRSAISQITRSELHGYDVAERLGSVSSLIIH